MGGISAQTVPDFRGHLDLTRYRADGSLKGQGFLGEMPNAAGKTASEISIGVDPSEISPTAKPNTGEGYVDIPTMVPTLNENELSYLLGTRSQDIIKNNPRLMDQIQEKAVDFARQRQAQNKPYFATTDESPKANPRFRIKPTLNSEQYIEDNLK
jgi:hypothetical protein